MGSCSSNAAATNSTTELHRAAPPPSSVSRPITKPKPYRHGANLTQGDLNNQRTEFWSTRVDGDATMWQAIRTSAEAILDNDLPLANAILEASNIKTPNGSLDVCYDERGHLYKVPIYLFAQPVELTTPSDMQNYKLPSETDHKKKSSGNTKPLNLKIRINPGDYSIAVDANTGFTIHELKESIVVAAAESKKGIPPLTVERQRVIFLGKELQNGQSVEDIGLDESRVVQVFIRPLK